MTANSIYTIGHSNHSLEGFVTLLDEHRVTAVADVRSVPHSRFNPQFNRDVLAEALKTHGFKYVFLGCELGGRPDDLTCYENDRVNYDRAARTDRFRVGLQRLIDGAAQYRIAIMCAEKEPLDCHRTLLVARVLHEQGVDVSHILADGETETHGRSMDRLLAMHGLNPEGDMLTTREEFIATAIERQAIRKAYTNDDRKVDGKRRES